MVYIAPPAFTGTVDSYSVSPPLPTGIYLDVATGKISGTPTVKIAKNTYTIKASNVYGFTSANIEITVLGKPTKLEFLMQPVNAKADTSISPAITVVVKDEEGDEVTNSSASVTLAIGTNPGGAVFLGNPTVTAINGVATFSNIVINKSGAGYTLTAAATNLTPATSGAFNITFGTAAKLAFTVQPSSSNAYPTPIPTIKVTVQDMYSNAVTTATDPITLAIDSNLGGATLSGPSLTVNAVVGTGTATFVGLAINIAANGYKLKATAPAVTNGHAALVGTSDLFNITAMVSAVSPEEGLSSGGSTNTVTVTGSGFSTGAMVCFDTATNCCTTTSFVSTTQLTCTGVLAHSAGQVSVLVKDSSGQQLASKANAYTYVDDTNLKFWYKADTVIPLIGGSAVAAWPDSSGNGFDLSQTNTNLRPVFAEGASGTINGKPHITFAGASDGTGGHRLRASASAPTVNEYTLLLVARKDNGQGSNVNSGVALGLSSVYVDGAQRARNSFFTYSGNIASLTFGDPADTGLYWNNQWSSVTDYFLWTIVGLSTAANTDIPSVYKNGTTLGVANSGANVFTNDWNSITLGDDGKSSSDGVSTSNPGNFFNGDIAEVMGYSQALTDTSRKTVECYLDKKYGLSLPSGYCP